MSELETGILLVKKVRRGFEAKITIGDKTVTVPSFRPNDDKLNNKECQFQRVSGRVTQIIVDGQTIFPDSKSQNQNNQAIQANRHQKQRPQSQNRTQSHQTHSQPNIRGDEEVPDSLDISKTKLPKDIRIDLKDHIKDIDNFALKLNKAARFDDSDSKFKFYKTAKRRGEEEYCIKENFGDLKFEDFKTKMTQIKTSLESQGYKITKPLTMKPDWRLIVGLGNESVYETSITLHHIYGIPYIPGSAVKGVTRSYVITENFDSDENTALKDQTFVQIFGDQEHQGHIIFFDAFPTSAPKIEPDIMNPHYTPYYSDKNNQTPPADYHDPRPLFFLTVKDAEFDFYLGMKPKDQDKDNLLDKAKTWLEKALTTHGIGAKTAVGYGYFK